MKKTKKLVVTVCMLLMSAVLLISASYAWVAMNTIAKLDGINVEAYSDSLFLEISTDAAGTYSTSVTLSGDEQVLRLSKHQFIGTTYELALTEVDTDTYYTGAAVNYYTPSVGMSDTYSEKNYTKVVFTDDDRGSLVEGLYIISAISDPATKTVEDASIKYFEISKGGYKPVTLNLGDSTKGYKTATVSDPLAAGSRYSDGNSYFRYDDVSKTYYQVDNLSKATNLKGYYTISETESVATGKNLYEKNANGDYYYVGNFANAEDMDNYLYWGRAYSNDVNSIDGQPGNTLAVIKETNLGDYRYANTVYLRNGLNTNNATNLRVESVNVTGVDSDLFDAIRVLLVASDYATGDIVSTIEYDAGLDTFKDDKTLILDKLLGNTQETVQVDIYVYFDGTDAVANNVNTEAGILGGQSIAIEFAIDGHDYN